jgi:hypothetical protein
MSLCPQKICAGIELLGLGGGPAPSTDRETGGGQGFES